MPRESPVFKTTPEAEPSPAPTPSVPDAKGAKETIEAAVKKQLENKLAGIGRIFEYFEAAEMLNADFTPDILSQAFRESKKLGLKAAEEKFQLPSGMLEAFTELSQKIGTTSILEIFRIFRVTLEEYKRHDKIIGAHLNQLDNLREKWQKIRIEKIREEDAAFAKRAEETKTAKRVELDSLAAKVMAGKLSLVEAFDLTAEQKKALLNYASELAQKPGLEGANFYEKLNALGLTPKTARVSETMAHFRDRAASGRVEEVGRGYTGIGGVVEAMTGRSSLIESRPLARPEPARSKKAMVEQPKTEQLKAEEQAQAKKPGLFRRFWSKIFGGAYEPQKPKEYLSEAKIETKAARTMEAKYRPLVRKLKELGTSFEEASRFAGIPQGARELAIDIFMGKKVLLTDNEERILKEAIKKAFQFSADSKNKARQLLAELFNAAADEVGLFRGVSRLKPKARKAIAGAHEDLERGAAAAGRAGQSR
ncbi:MAG: hypothetical protein HY982_00915 [Candidatus Magasanikbacteria bacterium]|nr:hypothetical protein [Candidatus Magasanikbacteria bacterium]